MLKILHLFRVEKFTAAFIEMIRKNLGDQNHFFLIWGNITEYSDLKYLKFSNVKYVPFLQIELRKEITVQFMDRYDKIIYHGLFEGEIFEFFFKNRYLIKKLYLYFWGGDKYLSGNMKENFLKKYVVKKSAGIITIIPQEQADLKDRFKPQGKWYCATYYDPQWRVGWENLRKREEGVGINVVVGNSATESNCHIEILNQLSKYRFNDIRIYIPLSYGDRKYAETVKNFGYEIFGEKVVALENFMSLPKYQQFLSEMDIGIFGMKRQQALGNLYALFGLGCKIFLRKDGLLDNFFGSTLNCKFSYIEDIPQMDFEEFILFDDKKRKDNLSQMIYRCRETYAMEEWKNIFVDN